MSTYTHANDLPLPYNLSNAPDWFSRRIRFAGRIILNLAPIRYAMVAEEGGPVENLEYGQISYLNRAWHQCRATLLPEFRHPMGEKLCLFNAADGSGMGQTRLEARARAVSEALERWAYQESSSGPDSLLYGYQYADSTKGMAAFPSLFPGQARRAAVAEAHEYYAIDAWWAGTLRHWIINRDDATIVFIDQPEYAGYIALAIRNLDLNQYVASYGIGSGTTPQEAELKAQLEACRSESILQARERIPENARRRPVLETEQNLLRFASPEGHTIVLDRLASQPWLPPIKPKVVFDGPVKGPWNKYTHVWRHALQPFPVRSQKMKFVA